jgi:hypothetical protein
VLTQRSMSRAVAVLVLALLLAPFAHAAGSTALGSGHSCCPRSDETPSPDAPCQFASPTACCAQSGVPRSTSSETSPSAPFFVALDRVDAPVAARPVPQATLVAATPPPDTRLLRSIVLQL